jgi:hypothetical protein
MQMRAFSVQDCDEYIQVRRLHIDLTMGLPGRRAREGPLITAR